MKYPKDVHSTHFADPVYGWMNTYTGKGQINPCKKPDHASHVADPMANPGHLSQLGSSFWLHVTKVRRAVTGNTFKTPWRHATEHHTLTAIWGAFALYGQILIWRSLQQWSRRCWCNMKKLLHLLALPAYLAFLSSPRAKIDLMFDSATRWKHS